MKLGLHTKHKILRETGYTLIEILISLTIIGLLFGFGYVSFRDFARRQEVVGTAKTLQGNLRLAQQQALSGQKPEGCGTLDGVRVNIDSSSGSYLVEAVCGASVLEIKGPISIPADLSILSSQQYIQFNVLGNGTNVDSTNPAVITLTQSGTEYEAKVTITAGGEIK